MDNVMDAIEQAVTDAGGSMTWEAMADAVDQRYRQRLLKATKELHRQNRVHRKTEANELGGYGLRLFIPSETGGE